MTRYKKIIEIMNTINRSVDFQSLMSTIIDSAKELLQSEGASLLLVDKETDELIFDIVISCKGEIIQGKRIKVGAGIAGEVARTEKPLIVNDAVSDPRFYSDIDRASGFITKNIIAAPVIMKDRLVGVLEAVNSSKPEGFSGDDLVTMGYLADAAAISINNQELVKNLRNRVDELTCIYEISQSIYFSTDVHEFLSRVISAIHRVIRAERCSFVILDDSGTGVRYCVTSSGALPPSQVDIENSLMSHVIRSGDPLLVHNLDEFRQFERIATSRYQSKSFLCVPIKLHNRVIGVLNVTDKPHSEIFDSFDLRVLSTISQQVA
ncbi:MAG: GAF domain-containing protein, partial [Spirochaetota bacterium]